MAEQKLTLEESFERMEEVLDKASTMPFSSKKVIDAELMRQYIDEARINMPAEIRQAQDTQRDRQAILAEASKEADDIIRKAKEDAKKLVSQEAVIQQATDYAKQIIAEADKQAADIVAQARAKDKAIKEALSDNLNKSLTEAANILSKSLKDVNDTRDAVSKLNPNAEKTEKKAEKPAKEEKGK
ncbi:MAG: hypothetical protein IJ571_09890 [Ruminococcus sp.]|nr:hypothetical protein [Ruminococcus sp.]